MTYDRICVTLTVTVCDDHSYRTLCKDLSSKHYTKFLKFLNVGNWILIWNLQIDFISL